MARPAKKPQPPTARYQLLERVAKGGMAELFKARVVGPEGFDKLVAVKRILDVFCTNEEFVRMFIDEARLAALLNHPNLVQVFELGRDVEDNLFISMELVHGPELATILDNLRARRRRMPEAAALEILVQALRGLHHAHTKKDIRGKPLNLVHRDVSPQNILVTTEGVAKLLDFGVAKAHGRLTETQAGLVKGKLLYMSPEQSRNKPIDARSDQFAAALVLWECLAGEPCYTFPTEQQLHRAVALGEVRLLSDLGVKVDPELEAALFAALAPKPEDRFENCEDFANALLRYKQRKYPQYTPSDLGELVEVVCPEEIAKLSALPDLDGPNVVPLQVATLDVSTIEVTSKKSRVIALAGGVLAVAGIAAGAGGYWLHTHQSTPKQVTITHNKTEKVTQVVYRDIPGRPAPIDIDLDGGLTLEDVDLVDGGQGRRATLADGRTGWILALSDGTYFFALGYADGGRALVPVSVPAERRVTVQADPDAEPETWQSWDEAEDGGLQLNAHLPDGGLDPVVLLADGGGEIHSAEDGAVLGYVEPIDKPVSGGGMEVSAVRLDDGGIGYPANLPDAGSGWIVRLGDAGLALSAAGELTPYDGALPMAPGVVTTHIDTVALEDGGEAVQATLPDGGMGFVVTADDGVTVLEFTAEDGHVTRLPFTLPGSAKKK